MVKKCWFYISIFQFCIFVLIITIGLVNAFSVPKVEEANLQEYINQFTVENNYLPDCGYIPDAKTAKIIGSQMIDKLTGAKTFEIGSVSVTYDSKNRLWKVGKTYLSRRYGGFVIIEQDSGKIIKALLVK